MRRAAPAADSSRSPLDVELRSLKRVDNKTLRRLIFDQDKLTRRDREALIIFGFLAVLVFTAACIVLHFDGKDGTGEPFELFEGISIWPTEICRLLMILLCWIFLSQAIASMKESDRMLTRKNIGVPADNQNDISGFWQRRDKVRHEIAGTIEENSKKFILVRWMKRVILEIRCLWLTQFQISVVYWDRERMNSESSVEIQKIWSRYKELGRTIPIFTP